VHATANFTGVGQRMLDIDEKQHITLYATSSCGGAKLHVPPGSDICDHSFVTMYDCTLGQGRVPEKKCFQNSATRVKGNVFSIMVPAGLQVNVTDKCETSDPYTLDEARIVGHCDNSRGAAPKCCNITSAHARSFRATKPRLACLSWVHRLHACIACMSCACVCAVWRVCEKASGLTHLGPA